MSKRTWRWSLAGGSLLVVALTGPSALAKTGFELMLRPGYGSAGSSSPVVYRNPPGVPAGTNDPGDVFGGSASPYGGGFVGDAFVGYRMLPILSAGLFGDYHASSATAPSDGTSDLSRSGWGLGFYARAYVPFPGAIEPWASIGIGYMHDAQTYKRSVTGDVDWTLVHYGVAVPLSVGVDYDLNSFFAVGPSFEYTIVAPAGGCADFSESGVSQSECTDASDATRVVSAKSYDIWSIALDLRLTL
jgi:Outer membrane protein beta-barrel domain